jgi:ATP phosphoribosyltransferase
MPDPSRTLKVAIPKGSLEAPTVELLSKAGY